jgi:hypothetical protein
MLDHEDEGNAILRMSLTGDTKPQGATLQHPL